MGAWVTEVHRPEIGRCSAGGARLDRQHRRRSRSREASGHRCGASVPARQDGVRVHLLAVGVDDLIARVSCAVSWVRSARNCGTRRLGDGKDVRCRHRPRDRYAIALDRRVWVVGPCRRRDRAQRKATEPTGRTEQNSGCCWLSSRKSGWSRQSSQLRTRRSCCRGRRNPRTT